MNKLTSVLVISPDEKLQTSLGIALGGGHYKVTAKTGTAVEMNGTATRLASAHDIVLIDLESTDAEVLETARTLSEARAPGSKIIALAGEDLPLSQARALNKVGVDDVLPRGSLKDEIIPQIEAWRIRQSAQLPALWMGQATEGKIVAVAKSRGGVGASSVAVNLAEALQDKRGLRHSKAMAEVALVDLDFQFGSIAAQTDVQESDAMWRMAMDGTVPDASFLEQAMMETAGGLSVLTAPSRYGPLSAVTNPQIAAILDQLKKTYDYVVVDLPPALVEWIDPVLSRADRLLLVTDVTVPSVRSARKLIDFYLAEHPGLDIQIVANFESKPMILGSHHRAAMELLERSFSHWIPFDPKAAREALDRGRPVGEVAGRSHLSKAIKKIAREMIKELPLRSKTNQDAARGDSKSQRAE